MRDGTEMPSTTAYYIDKSSWPRGEWDSEPDAVLWVDKDTELPCLVARHSKRGFLRGYVGVDGMHPLWGVYENEVKFDLHGEVEFAGVPADMAWLISKSYTVGGVWWFGFSATAMFDFSPTDTRVLEVDKYRSISYMQKECRHLAAQLSEVDPLV